MNWRCFLGLHNWCAYVEKDLGFFRHYDLEKEVDRSSVYPEALIHYTCPDCGALKSGYIRVLFNEIQKIDEKS